MIEFRDYSDVQVIDRMGSDFRIVNAARVSTALDCVEPEELSARDLGTLGFLMRNRHASPFEHCAMTVKVETPIFVAREFMRHRTLSFNEFSGRYSEFKPVFYAPGEMRPLMQQGKIGEYTFDSGPQWMRDAAEDLITGSVEDAWNTYVAMLDAGVAREVARMVLPVTTFTSFYATGNLRAWLNFLALRTAPDALFEIRDVAHDIELFIRASFPATWQLWVAEGRGQL